MESRVGGRGQDLHQGPQPQCSIVSMERGHRRATQPHLEHHGHGLRELTGYLGGERERRPPGGKDWVGSPLIIPLMLTKPSFVHSWFTGVAPSEAPALRDADLMG